MHRISARVTFNQDLPSNNKMKSLSARLHVTLDQVVGNMEPTRRNTEGGRITVLAAVGQFARGCSVEY